MPMGHRATQGQEGDNVVVLGDLTLHNPAGSYPSNHQPWFLAVYILGVQNKTCV